MYKSSVKTVSAIGGQNPIPDKLFYKIGEVSRIADIEPYVLRYWETEFPFLKPRKNKSGQRVYVKKDLELILEIKRLLYQERYTIEGVRKRFGENTTFTKHPAPPEADKVVDTPLSDKIIEHVRKRLREILNSL
ncbi:MAG: MerR family transcriptional regulator [Nitrospirae bacterium CG_4_10_14_3_um_filter_44_29]|nr:MerR family transcriptional regulator [Nitrospirota bacterium]PIP70109.1 MAG: MerR family transcriptional regulator [Nitrospirae bacterium CG22_combo_CG10-13_8_21_14_all_44_11]PIV43759.1 MAG: MerR family transcriptional regulator [Nitrospirae bacterium CG02_land_8_20_14_3_00_44_33]PIV66953.1 MAG: MerR family transcriptional regulator [Nitrospirae bacterium CG01_land_8_20_14_3_00_44_22]PIW89465.1 MAG: MerR family transcriptional regulator [Nitrospirae bacterium CG_4_8_14_3_um_filter_44_28]PI